MYKKIVLTSTILTLIPQWSPAEQLAPIIISAARTEQTTNKTPTPISVIDRETIVKSGATTIAELLLTQTNIQLSSLYGNGTRTTISLRGFGSNAFANTLILIDGRRLNNPDIASADIQGIQLDDIEQIEIIEGSAGVLFGEGAVGGVVNIITRKPVGFHASSQVTVASYKRKALNGSISDRLESGFGYRVSAEREIADNYRDRNELGSKQFSLMLDQQFSGHRVFTEYRYADEKLQFPGALNLAALQIDREQAQNPDDQFHTETHSARLGGDFKINSQWHLEAELTGRKIRGAGVLSGDLKQKRRLYSFNPRLIGQLEQFNMTFGADIERSKYKLVSGFGEQFNRQSMESLYGQITYSPIQTFSITGGSRYTWVRNELKDSFTFPTGKNHGDRLNVASLGAKWFFIPNWDLFTKWDQNFRFAKVDENLDSSTGEVLKNQTGDNFEVGLEYNQQGNQFKVNLFRQDLENEIDADPSASPFGDFPANTNLDDTKRQGISLNSHWFINQTVQLGANYAWLDADFSHGTYKGNRIPLVSKHHFAVNARWQVIPKLSLFAELNYLSKQDVAGDYANILDKVGSRTLINLSAFYQIKQFKITARVNNLTDKKYQGTGVRTTFPDTEAAFYPAPERNFLITFGIDL